MTQAEKRQKIESLVLGAISRLEKGDQNTNRYKAFFKSLSDEEFAQWASQFKVGNFDQCIQIFVEPFNEPRMDNIEECAKFLDLPLEEYIYYRDKGDFPVRSRIKCPVGYVHIKRMQQLLSKKNHYSLDNEERSIKTNQVTGSSKVASMSDAETSALVAVDANRSLEEFLGFRSDDAYTKMQAYKQIVDQGFISLDELEKNQSSSSQTAETINTYLLCAGVRTDLVNNNLKTRYTIDQELKRRS